MVLFDSETEIKEASELEELKGKLSKQGEEDKLMNSVMSNDKKTIEDGKMIKDALNQGMSSFTPDLVFEQLVKNYSMAKKLLGPKLIKRLTSYDPNYIERNIKIPEFQRELKKVIESNIDKLKWDGYLEKDGSISDSGLELASLILYTEELDNIIPKGLFGEKVHKKDFIYGYKEDVKNYKKGERYRDIAIKKSAKLAIRRAHNSLSKDDLKIYEKQAKGKISIIYALDASGSMKGKKIEVSKKAGIALAYKAIDAKDKVGLIVFGSEIKDAVEPTDDFRRVLLNITKVKPAKETNIAITVKKAVELFCDIDATNHLILLTDAMPTVGKDPEEETLEAVSIARANKITISVIGINLERKGQQLAEKIARLGEGRIYIVKNLTELDKIVLEDYYSVV